MKIVGSVGHFVKKPDFARSKMVLDREERKRSKKKVKKVKTSTLGNTKTIHVVEGDLGEENPMKLNKLGCFYWVT